MLRRTHVAVVLVIVVLIVAGMPGDAANREHQQMMAEIRMLQEQAQQLQAMLGALGEAIKAVGVRLDEQAGVNRKAFADQKLLTEAVSTDLRVVREKVDETNVRITSLSQEVEALRLSVPAAMTPAPPSPAEPAGGVLQAPTGPEPTAAASPGMSPQRLYDSALADYSIGQWSLAIAGFSTYIKTFPRSELADDAQYYIGQTYFNDGKWKEAAATYDEVIVNYPKSNLVPEAYYKRGLAFDRLGQTDRARESFDFVVKNYPDTDAGRLAKQSLDRLNRPVRD